MDVRSSLLGFYLLLAVAGPIIAGCYPRPHKYIRSQALAGVLLKGGDPVAGAKVLIAHTRVDGGNYCHDARVVAVTNQDGRFKVAASSELDFFSSLLNPSNSVGQVTSICFEMRSQQKLGVLLVAATDRETPLSMSCDLDSPPVAFKQNVIWPKDKWGICRNIG